MSKVPMWRGEKKICGTTFSVEYDIYFWEIS
jgi:hypothetical protein